jgi:enamine deaminase RidA (YjgF/YER057c/UK114 family)
MKPPLKGQLDLRSSADLSPIWKAALVRDDGMSKKGISIDKAVKPLGPYSQAVRAGDFPLDFLVDIDAIAYLPEK